MTTRTLLENIQQAKISIYFAARKFAEKHSIAQRGAGSVHQGSYAFEEDGLTWFMTRIGFFQYGDMVRVNRAVSDLKEAFTRSHPSRQTDKRIMIAKVTPSVDDSLPSDDIYFFDVKWRMMDNEDPFFKQINFVRVNLDEFIVDPSLYPDADSISFDGITVPIEEAEPETDDVPDGETYHLLNDIGIYKKTVRDRFTKNWDITAAEHQDMLALMDAYRQRYTLEELDLISAYLVPDKMRDILDTYYGRDPQYFDEKINGLDVRNAEAAEGDYQKMRDYIDLKMLQNQTKLVTATNNLSADNSIVDNVGTPIETVVDLSAAQIVKE